MSPADVQAVIDRACEQDPEFVRRLTTLASAPGAAPEPEVGPTPATEAVPPFTVSRHSLAAGRQDHGRLAAGRGER